MRRARLHRRLHDGGTTAMSQSGYRVACGAKFSTGVMTGFGGPLTFSRAGGGVYVYDHDGVLRYARDNESAFINLRRVENVLARMGVVDSRNLLNGGFTAGTDATLSRDLSVLTDDGLPSNKITWIANTSNAQVTAGTIASTVADKRSWIATFKLRAGTGTACTIGITDGTTTFLASKAVVLTSSWQVFSVAVASTAPASEVVGIRITRGGVDNIYVDWVQMEETTGASVQVFGGYADVLTQYGANIAGVRYYDHANGNTRNATTGIITEAPGAAITTGRLLIEGQATNLIAASNYRDISTWTRSGSTMEATTPILIDGTTGASAKNEVKENALAGEHRATVAFTASTSAKQSAMVAVKRGTGTRHVQLRMNNATDGDYGSVAYNLDTLATIGTVTAEYTTAYVKGGYTIIELVDTNTTTGAQNLYVNLHDGTSNSYTGNGTSTLVMDWAQVVTGGHAQSNIVGEATRYASILSRLWFGETNNLWLYVDVYPRFTYNLNVTNSLMFFALFTSANDYLRCRIPSDGAATLQTETNDSPNYQNLAITGFSFARGNRIRILASYDGVDGLRVRANMNGTLISGTISTYKSPLKDLRAATLAILNYDGSAAANVFFADIAEYKMGASRLTVTQMQDMVGL